MKRFLILGLIFISSCVRTIKNDNLIVNPTGNDTIISYCGSNGTIDPLGQTIIKSGSNKTFVFIPNTGFHVSNVLVDNISVGKVSSYTFNAISENHIINAIFRNDSFSSDTIPINGLVAWYPFNGNSNDESGYNHNGINTGASLCLDRNGNASRAYSFVNTQKIVTDYKGITGNGNRTVSLWFNNQDMNDAVPIFFYGGSLGGATQIYLSSDNRIIIDASNSTVTYERKVPYNSWHNVILTYTQSYGNTVLSFKIYLDGELLTNTYDTYNVSQLISNSNGLLCNVTFGGIWSYSKASVMIDDIAIYNRVLSAEEIGRLSLY